MEFCIMDDLSLTKNQVSKIQRSARLIKGFMALIVLTYALQFYQSGVIDFGEVAGAIGTLALFRALMLSPMLLIIPFKEWFQSKITFSKASIKYLLLAFVLIIVRGC